MPIEMFNEEVASLIPYLKIELNRPIIAKPEKVKELPNTIVQKTNLIQYDLLLSGVAA